MLKKMLDSQSKIIKLGCNRNLCYREYGALEGGFPVIFAHGNLNSRLFSPRWDKTDSETKEAGIRLIAVDRPGYGYSTMQPNRSYSDFAKDIEELSQILNLEKYSVLGYSSGGPHALACCFNKNVQSCGLISSDGPYKILGLDVKKKVYGIDFKTHQQSIELSKKTTQSLISAYNGMKNQTRKELALADITNATIQGYVGPSWDSMLETSDWNIDLANIPKHIQIAIYHGEKDNDVPTLTSQYLSQNINTTTNLEIIKGENHSLIRRYWKRISSEVKDLALNPSKI